MTLQGTLGYDGMVVQGDSCIDPACWLHHSDDFTVFRKGIPQGGSSCIGLFFRHEIQRQLLFFSRQQAISKHHCPVSLMPEPHIVFLTYLNRSGSTYLAAKLSRYKTVKMGIEARFVDGWIRPGFSVRTAEELNSYLDRLYQDTKFQAWQIDRQELIKHLTALPLPLRFSDVLLTALLLYQSGNPEKHIWVHKCGEYYRCVERIRQELPRAKFIFINRDPRAVFSSQRRSLDSQTGQPMLNNVLHFLFGYLDTLRRLEQLQNDPDFLTVQYEKLLADEEKVMIDIEQFLGLPSRAKQADMSGGSYFSSIPTEQQHLHAHVRDGRPCADRITGWQQELPVSDLLLLQTVLKRYLLAKGFPLHRPAKIGVAAFSHFVFLLCLYWYESSKRKLFHIEHTY